VRAGALERAFDVALGVSVVSWGALRLATAPAAARFGVVTLTLVAVNACVGVLFLARAPAVEHGPSRAIVESVPSMVAGGVALSIAPPPESWRVGAQIAFASGGALAVLSLVSLGRSFAILPALRKIVRRGAYRVVRHPVYVGELAMVAACGAARADALALVVVLAAVAASVARIHAEERLLVKDAEYTEYARDVRWRLVPRIW